MSRRASRWATGASAVALAALGLTVASSPAQAAAPRTNFYVDPAGTSTTCSAAGSQACAHVQQAVDRVATLTGTVVTIHIADGTYRENISLADVPATDSVTLLGASESGTVLDGDAMGTVVTAGGAGLTVERLTLTDGNVSPTSTAGSAVTAGSVPVEIADTTVDDNSGSAVTGTDLTIHNSTFEQNSTEITGGAIDMESAGSLSVDRSTFAENSAYEGGAIHANGYPGIHVAITNSTFVANAGNYGAAVAFDLGADASVASSTFAANIGAYGIAANNTKFTASIISDTPCASGLTDGGYNVESDDSCELGDTSVVDSDSIDLADALAANGSVGPQTLAIDEGSSAEGVVPAESCPVRDERGADRSGDACDAGAFELDPAPVSISSPASAPQYSLGAVVLADYICVPPDGRILVSCTGEDVDGAVPVGTPIHTPPGSHTFTVTATYDDGSSQQAAVTYTVELAAPSVSIMSPQTDARYGFGALVRAQYGCNPNGHGTVVSCVAPVADGQPIDTSHSSYGQFGDVPFAFTVTGQFSDGSTASATVHYSVDPPGSIEIDSPADGAVLFQGTTVLADYRCTPPLAKVTVTSCSGTTRNHRALPTSTVGEHSLSVHSTYSDGGRLTRTVHYRVIAKPIKITSPIGGHHYAVGARITVAYSCPRPSGLAVVYCRGPVPSGTKATLTRRGAASFTVTVQLATGATTTKTVRYYVDARPSVSISSPLNGHTYRAGSIVLAHYSCHPGTGQVLASCRAAVGHGKRVSTSRGTHTFSVTAKDRDGLSTTRTVTYHAT